MKTFTVKHEEQGTLVDTAINPENVLYCNVNAEWNGHNYCENPGRTYIFLKGNITLVAEEPFEIVRAKLDEALRDETISRTRDKAEQDALKNLLIMLTSRVGLLVQNSILLGQRYSESEYNRIIADADKLIVDVREALTKKER